MAPEICKDMHALAEPLSKPTSKRRKKKDFGIKKIKYALNTHPKKKITGGGQRSNISILSVLEHYHCMTVMS